jgi:serine/threonine protein kinase
MTKEEDEEDDAVEKYIDQVLEGNEEKSDDEDSKLESEDEENKEEQEVNEAEAKEENKEEVTKIPLMTKLSKYQEKIKKLTKAAVMTPVIANNVQLVVHKVPYLSICLKKEMAIAATNYEVAYVAHAAFLKDGVSTLEDDVEVSNIKGCITTLETEKSKLESEESALEAKSLALEDEKASMKAEEACLEREESELKQKRSEPEAEESVLEHEISLLEREVLSLKSEEARLDVERSVIEAERSAMEEDSEQEAEPLSAFENDREVQIVRAAAAKAQQYAKEKALSARERDLSAKEKALSAKEVELERALSAKKVELERALSAKKVELERALSAKKEALSAKKVELERALSARVTASKDALSATLLAMIGHISHMEYTLKVVVIILQICSTMSQAESTITCGEVTGKMRRDFILDNHDADHVFAGVPDELSSLINNRTRLSYQDLMSKDLRRLKPKKLIAFAGYWEALILNCTIVCTSSDTTKNMIVTVMKEIGASVHGPSWPNQEKSHPFPGLVSQEVNSVQPLIFGLFGALGKCCKVYNKANRWSLPKTDIDREVTVAATKTRKRRIMDGCAGKHGRQYPVNMDVSMKLPIEAKPFTRGSLSFEKLDEESRNQIIGHIAKYGVQGLQTFSLGKTTWITGVTANQAYIIVYRLDVIMDEYCGDGTPFVKLKLAESVRLPLMTATCFASWIAKCEAANPDAFTPKLRDEINKLKEELYGTAEKKIASVDINKVPLGIRVLWDLLQKRRIDLFGPDYAGIIRSGGNKNIRKLLGTGSFGLVFSYRLEGEKVASAVLKVPILQKCTHLERELKILQVLEREKDTNTTIDEGMALPVVMKVLHNIPIVLGGIKRELKGLVLRPRGMPLTYCVRAIEQGNRPNVLRECVGQVWSQVKAALMYMHKKNVYHNDVTPKNIVVCYTEKWNVCLVDFGSTFHKCGNDKKMTGFQGTPNYAHLDILKSYPSTAWKHQDGRYDFFGLTLTVIAMFNEGEACWDMKPFPALITKKNRKELCDVLEERKKKAVATIHESGCSLRLQNEWKYHIETERLADFFRTIQDPAATASGEDASLQVPFQGTEAEAPRHPPTRTGLRSNTRRIELGTFDHNSLDPSSKKRRRIIDEEPTAPSSKK